MNTMKKIVIIGCGPKAIAVAVKAHVLHKLGWQVPEIVIIDKFGVAANWDGKNGYTDGDTILGTTPFEDIGFPYDSIIDKSIDEEMLRFSYTAYLIDIGTYAEWVDRALTPPTHRMLADYLKWLAHKINIVPIIAEVTEVSLTNDKWSVTYKKSAETGMITCDGLVLTGPGDPYAFPCEVVTPSEEIRVFDGRNVWENMHIFKGIQNARIAVIGAGETTAGVVTALVGAIGGTSSIQIITRHPILFTRNEHWMEVMYYSKVMNWSELSKSEKMEIIRHADRGTFSVAAKHLLDSAHNVSLHIGNAQKLEINNQKVRVLLSRNNQETASDYDYVVQATGFDPFSFVNMFSDKSIFDDPQKIVDSIDKDLSVEGVFPKIHLPGLSALAQGPGFPNLSSLGLLAERILTPYIEK